MKTLLTDGEKHNQNTWTLSGGPQIWLVWPRYTTLLVREIKLAAAFYNASALSTTLQGFCVFMAPDRGFGQ